MALELVGEKSVVSLDGDVAGDVDCIDHCGVLFVRDGERWREANVISSAAITTEEAQQWPAEPAPHNSTE